MPTRVPSIELPPSFSFTQGVLHLPPLALLLLIVFTRILIFADRGVMAALMPILRAGEIEMSQLKAGCIGSICIIGILISTPLAAHLSKSHHPFTMVTAGQLVWILSQVMMFQSNNYWTILAARLITGLSEGIYLTALSPCVLEIAPSRSKTLWYSVYSCSIPIGMSVGYIFGSSVGQDMGWRTVIIIEAAWMTLPTLCFLLVYRDPRLDFSRKEHHEKLSFAKELHILAKNRVYVWMVLGMSAMLFTNGGLDYWMPYILKFQYGVDQRTTGFITGLVVLLGGTIGALLGSAYQDHMLSPYTKLVDKQLLSEVELIKLRSSFSLQVCSTSSWLACLVLVIGALSDNLTAFVLCYSLGTFINSLNNGSFGVALLSCVDVTLRTHSVAIAYFVGQLIGGLPSSFVTGVLIQCIEEYWAVVSLMSILGLCHLCWNLAYQEAKKAVQYT